MNQTRSRNYPVHRRRPYWR